MRYELLKIFLSVMTLLMGANLNSAFSQSIEGSTWFACNVYDDSTYLKFEGDTIYFKAPEVQGFENFTAVSIYAISNDTLFWNDLEASNQCEPNITGTYNFQVNSDTLTFSAIEDQCDFRLGVLSELILKRELSTSFSTTPEASAQIFPNPVTNDQLTIKFSHNFRFDYQIFSSTGQLKMQGNAQEKAILNLRNLPSGTYFMKIYTPDFERTEAFTIIKL